MIPAKIIVLDQMPLTANGKLDRDELSRRDLLEAAPVNKSIINMTTMEAELSRLIEMIVEVDAVGPDDNFFDLGGHSLCALRLAVAIEAKFGQPIASTEIYRAFTVKELAVLVGEKGSGNDWRHLLLMNKEVSGPPLFCIHGFYGTVDDYLHLARSLDSYITIYGVRLGYSAASITGPAPIATLAASFEAEIRSLQPRGPYRICGFSYGGVPAFELSRRLESAGENVTLFLLDGYPVSRFLLAHTWVPRFIKMLQARDVIGTIKRKSNHLIKSVIPYPLKRRHQDMRRTLMSAALRYFYTPFSGRIVLIKGMGKDNDRSWNIKLDGYNGWKRHSKGELTKFELNAGHTGMMKEPYVDQV
jgi:thioesterase domain-containing protein/acyl carrier protein